MQFKNMKYVLICQLLSNAILGTQLVLEGQASTCGVVAVALVQTIISYILGAKKKAFPVWLTCVFIVIFTVVSIITYKSVFDILTCLAVWFFAIGIVQKRSSICRIYSLVNSILWLTYDIFCAPSAVLTHAVIIVFIVVGMIRLDREDWKKFFAKLGKKQTKNEEVVAETKNIQ
jgi:hypothetical protein